tara:strand:- start:499 stop:1191 length:693 start_codon:yes stop_codon:yes gene_type:complete
MKVICTICARGGSKGIKNKNYKRFLNKPLIYYVIRSAIKTKLFEHIVVSTDSKKISNLAIKYGAKSWFLRPKYLSKDNSPKLPVIQHALKESEKYFNQRFDVQIDLQATSPLLTAEDIKKAYKKFINSKCDNLITVTHSKKNPYFDMVEVKKGRTKLVKSLKQKIIRRQDAPKVYDLNGAIYIWKRKSILNTSKLINSKTAIYLMPESRSIDIDNKFDWKIAQFLKNNKI